MKDLDSAALPDAIGRTRPRRGFRRVLVIVGALALILALVRLTQRHKTQSYLESIRKEGLPATLDEANSWYAMVPFDENAALKFLEAADSKIDPPAKLQERLPIVGKVENLPEAGAGIPSEMREAIESYLSDNEFALQLVHEAVHLKKSRYPMDLRQGFNTLLPHLARLKGMTQSLKLEGIYYSEQHQTDLAVRSALTSFALAHSLKDEPLMISQLVRIACVAITLSGLERTLCENVLTEEQLRALAEKIKEAEADSDASPLRAMAGERCTGVDAFTMPPQRLASLWGQGPTPSGVPQEVQVVLLHLAKISGVRDRDFHFYLNSLTDFINAARLPYPDRLKKSQEISTRVHQQLSMGRWLFLSKQLLPSTVKFFDKEASISAHLRCAQVALALERYRLAHNGEVPKELDELAPKFLESLPEDTFDHQPLDFERLVEGYRIISPGATAKRGPGTKNNPLPPVGFVVKR